MRDDARSRRRARGLRRLPCLRTASAALSRTSQLELPWRRRKRRSRSHIRVHAPRPARGARRVLKRAPRRPGSRLAAPSRLAQMPKGCRREADEVANCTPIHSISFTLASYGHTISHLSQRATHKGRAWRRLLPKSRASCQLLPLLWQACTIHSPGRTHARYGRPRCCAHAVIGLDPSERRARVVPKPPGMSCPSPSH